MSDVFEYNVATMFIDSCTSTTQGRTYTRHLLRESFREHGKVRHRTLANLSHASDDEIRAMKLALKHKHNLQQLGNVNEDILVQQGQSVGAVIMLWQVARRIGLIKALGNTQTSSAAVVEVTTHVAAAASGTFPAVPCCAKTA